MWLQIPVTVNHKELETDRHSDLEARDGRWSTVKTKEKGINAYSYSVSVLHSFTI